MLKYQVIIPFKISVNNEISEGRPMPKLKPQISTIVHCHKFRKFGKVNDL